MVSLAALPNNSGERQLELASQGGVVGPQESELLGEICSAVREWQSSPIYFSLPTNPTELVALPDFRIERILLDFGISQWKESPLTPYQGIFSTGPINSGIRGEIGPTGEIAVLLEAPDLGENAFRPIALQEYNDEISTFRFAVEFVLDENPGSLVVGNTVLPLPDLTETSCSRPRIGVGFSDERSFTGVVDLSVFALGTYDAEPRLIVRSSARWLIVALLASSGAIWLYGRAREEGLE